MSMRFLSLGMCAGALALASLPATARELKLCAEPNNMPFSNEKAEGFENRVAKLVAEEIGATAKFTFTPEWRGFVRKGLNAGLCDVIAGVPSKLDRVRTTHPYYQASYEFVQPAGATPITSFDAAELRNARIGVQLVGDDGANTPPMDELARRGITSNIRGFMVLGDWSKPNPLAPIVDAVANHEVDVAVVWGPVADYFAAKHEPALLVTPAASAAPGMSFAISMGVRKKDRALAEELNRAIDRRQSDIRAILAGYHVRSTLDLKSAKAE